MGRYGGVEIREWALTGTNRRIGRRGPPESDLSLNTPDGTFWMGGKGHQVIDRPQGGVKGMTQQEFNDKGWREERIDI